MSSKSKMNSAARTFANYTVLLVIICTLVPYISIEHWSIRAFDFPHLQLTLLTGMLLLLYTAFLVGRKYKAVYIIFALSICFAFQISKIWPYTPLGNYEVLDAPSDNTESFGIYTANVYQNNREKLQVVRDTERFNADILLFTETDAEWTTFLKERLNANYPYSVEVPKKNTYGMVLFSRFKLQKTGVRYLVEDTIPSIHAQVILPSEKVVQLYGIHPAPPTPFHNPRSLDRDAELIQIGRLSRTSKYPVIVMGDFNDVAWSETTSLFQSFSGLLDLRKGRGLFNTYHADYLCLRWPLDHVFVSPEFCVHEVKLGMHIGSDHFPFYTRLGLEPEQTPEQKLPVPDNDVIEAAREQILEEERFDSIRN